MLGGSYAPGFEVKGIFYIFSIFVVILHLPMPKSLKRFFEVLAIRSDFTSLANLVDVFRRSQGMN
jgi:hypothetical protein